jgi:hypothetical protein
MNEKRRSGSEYLISLVETVGLVPTVVPAADSDDGRVACGVDVRGDAGVLTLVDNGVAFGDALADMAAVVGVAEVFARFVGLGVRARGAAVALLATATAVWSDPVSPPGVHPARESRNMTPRAACQMVRHRSDVRGLPCATFDSMHNAPQSQRCRDSTSLADAVDMCAVAEGVPIPAYVKPKAAISAAS